VKYELGFYISEDGILHSQYSILTRLNQSGRTLPVVMHHYITYSFFRLKTKLHISTAVTNCRVKPKKGNRTRMFISTISVPNMCPHSNASPHLQERSIHGLSRLCFTVCQHSRVPFWKKGILGAAISESATKLINSISFGAY
jgi:hypothetical protein